MYSVMSRPFFSPSFRPPLRSGPPPCAVISYHSWVFASWIPVLCPIQGCPTTKPHPCCSKIFFPVEASLTCKVPALASIRVVATGRSPSQVNFAFLCFLWIMTLSEFSHSLFSRCDRLGGVSCPPRMVLLSVPARYDHLRYPKDVDPFAVLLGPLGVVPVAFAVFFFFPPLPARNLFWPFL